MLTPTDHTRLSTWAADIAEALLPAGAQREDCGADLRFTKSGGLSIAKRSGASCQHSSSTGGYSAVALISLLKQCSRAEAKEWAAAWLATHPGTGSYGGDDDNDDTSTAWREANAARDRGIHSSVLSPEGSVAAGYLCSLAWQSRARSHGVEKLHCTICWC
jgi:hypothetical protein